MNDLSSSNDLFDCSLISNTESDGSLISNTENVLEPYFETDWVRNQSIENCKSSLDDNGEISSDLKEVSKHSKDFNSVFRFLLEKVSIENTSFETQPEKKILENLCIVSTLSSNQNFLILNAQAASSAAGIPGEFDLRPRR